MKINIQKIAFLIAAIYGMTAVMLAALGSHLFHIEKGSINYLLFNNAVTYQLLHAILVLWLSTIKQTNFWIKSAIYSLLLGILLFCGGLYILVIYGKTMLSWITPVGGSFLILAWLNLSISGFQKIFKSEEKK
ncbi:MAG: DUF423 domain-containing protein [Alcanivoracaceae bacterium]|nr:DUF423 domain-containing protein [Alcanivoracaceae bacterium]